MKAQQPALPVQDSVAGQPQRKSRGWTGAEREPRIITAAATGWPRLDIRRTTVKKLGYVLPILLLIASATLRLHGQEGDGGCVDSPENPTAILALVGMAAVGINHLRNRFAGRK